MESLSAYIAGLGYWNWMILAVILLVFEMLLPGIYFLWLGFAAAFVGAVVGAVDMSWQWQVALFAVFSIVAVVLSHTLLKRAGMEDTDEPNLNKRAHQNIGRVAMLVDPIKGGRGRINLGDTFWQVKGPDLPVNAEVKIVGVDGTVLEVVPVDA